MTLRQEFIGKFTDYCIEAFEWAVRHGDFSSKEKRESELRCLTSDISGAVHDAYDTVTKAYLEGDYGL